MMYLVVIKILFTMAYNKSVKEPGCKYASVFFGFILWQIRIGFQAEISVEAIRLDWKVNKRSQNSFKVKMSSQALSIR